MKNKSKTFSICLFFLFIIVILGFTLFKCFKENQRIKQALPFLLPGEPIDYFKLASVDKADADLKTLPPDKTGLIFIFSRPCTLCNQNIDYWNKLTKILKKNGISFYGIIIDNYNEAFNFKEQKEIHFPLFVPYDPIEFTKRFRLKLKMSQTILFAENTVKYVSIGELDGEDLKNFILRARSLTALTEKK
jgi:peroxiredoxin